MKKHPIKLDRLPPAKVEIINLIDVLITLVAFFMLTTVFAKSQSEMAIELPQVRQAQAGETVNAKVVIEVDRQNRIWFEGQSILEDELAPKLQRQAAGTVVVIRADQACRYEAVIRILDLVKNSRLNKVSFEVKPIGQD